MVVLLLTYSVSHYKDYFDFENVDFLDGGELLSLTPAFGLYVSLIHFVSVL